MPTKEIWKDIQGWEGIYQVSNIGRVRRIKPKILKPDLKMNGYLGVLLCDNYKTMAVNIHRLVARAFKKQPPGKNYVVHKDHNKQNNNATNLSWATQSENIKQSYKTGNAKPRYNEDNEQCKITADEIKDIRQLRKDGALIKDIAKAYQVSPQWVSDVVNKKKRKYA